MLGSQHGNMNAHQQLHDDGKCQAALQCPSQCYVAWRLVLSVLDTMSSLGAGMYTTCTLCLIDAKSPRVRCWHSTYLTTISS